MAESWHQIKFFYFHFRDPKVTSSRSNFVCRFWKADMDFLIVFHSNHMLILHYQDDIDDFHIRDLEMTPKKVNQKSRCTFIVWAWWTYLSIDTLGLGATVKTLCLIFTFVTLTWPFIHGHPRAIFCGLWKSDIDFSVVFHAYLTLFWSWGRCLQHGTPGGSTKSATVRNRLDRFRCCQVPAVADSMILKRRGRNKRRSKRRRPNQVFLLSLSWP